MESMLLAAFLGPISILLGYYFVLPRAILFAYKRSIAQTAFEASGFCSTEVECYALYFDVRQKDIVISGLAPTALHWQIAAFDGFTRVVDGAYGNGHTVEADDEGNYSIRLTVQPQESDFESVFDCSENPRGVLIFRVVRPSRVVDLPEVHWVGHCTS